LLDNKLYLKLLFHFVALVYAFQSKLGRIDLLLGVNNYLL